MWEMRVHFCLLDVWKVNEMLLGSQRGDGSGDKEHRMVYVPQLWAAARPAHAPLLHREAGPWA